MYPISLNTAQAAAPPYPGGAAAVFFFRPGVHARRMSARTGTWHRAPYDFTPEAWPRAIDNGTKSYYNAQALSGAPAVRAPGLRSGCEIPAAARVIAAAAAASGL